jgi:hypothetical protein
LNLHGLNAFGAAHPQWKADHDFFDLVIADQAVEIGEIVFLVLPVQRLEALGGDAERIRDGYTNSPCADIETKNAVGGTAIRWHAAIIDGLRRQASLSPHGFAICGDILVVFFHGMGETVVALRVGDEVIVVAVGGVHGSFQGAPARIGNGAGR